MTPARARLFAGALTASHDGTGVDSDNDQPTNIPSTDQPANEGTVSAATKAQAYHINTPSMGGCRRLVFFRK